MIIDVAGTLRRRLALAPPTRASALPAGSVAGGDQATLVGRDDDLRAIPQMQLREDANDVALDGRLAEVQLAGDLGVLLLWLAAMPGMRRNEVLGLKWGDIDFQKKTIALNRGLVAVGYELHQTRGKTRNARRPIDLDGTTLAVLAGWKAFQSAEFAAVGIGRVGWVFTDGDGDPIHPHALSQAFERIARRAGVPAIRLHDLRHTHGTLLIKEGVPVKVVSERLGHAHIALTIQTYQHVLPGMQADAARAYERLTAPDPPAASNTVERRSVKPRYPQDTSTPVAE